MSPPKLKLNAANVEIDCADEIAGRFGDVIASIKTVSSGDGGAPNKLVVKFESGAAVVVDGQFPARAFLEPARAVQQELVGSALRSFRFRKSGAEEAIKGTDRFRQRYLVELETGDAVTTFDWIAIISPDFDVDPRPRISHRAAT